MSVSSSVVAINHLKVAKNLTRNGENELYLQTHKGDNHVAAFNGLRHIVPLNTQYTHAQMSDGVITNVRLFLNDYRLHFCKNMNFQNFEVYCQFRGRGVPLK